MMNGRGWESLTPVERGIYTLGIKDGMYLLSATIGGEAGSGLRHNNSAVGFSIDDYVKELTALYKSRQNINIPVVIAFQHVTFKLKGEMTKDQLESKLIELRKASNEMGR